jgi:hypothetical protein
VCQQVTPNDGNWRVSVQALVQVVVQGAEQGDRSRARDRSIVCDSSPSRTECHDRLDQASIQPCSLFLVVPLLLGGIRRRLPIRSQDRQRIDSTRDIKQLRIGIDIRRERGGMPWSERSDATASRSDGHAIAQLMTGSMSAPIARPRGHRLRL